MSKSRTLKDDACCLSSLQECTYMIAGLMSTERCFSDYPKSNDAKRVGACTGLVSSGAGRAILQGWGYAQDDVAEVEERLQNMASAYDQDDDF